MLEFLSSIGSLIIAVVALMQPWVLWFWRRFLRRGTIAIYETGAIEVGYGSEGATIGLQGTLRARERDFFIRAIQVEVTRLKDHSQHDFDWLYFRSISTVVGKPTEVALAVPSGFMLTAAQPEQSNILFFDRNLGDEIRPVLERVYKAYAEYYQKKLKDNPSAHGTGTTPEVNLVNPWNAYFEEFSQTPSHVTAYTTLDRLFYWDSGEYTLRLMVKTAKPDGLFESRWNFKLTEDDVNRVRLNSFNIIRQACGQYVWPYNFAFAHYGSLLRDSKLSAKGI